MADNPDKAKDAGDAALTETARYGLGWHQDTFTFEPQWTVEPDMATVEAMVREHLKLADCSASLYAQGGFNKLYKVEDDSGAWILRVALPVDPYRKTASEVATIDFVREKTSAPIPKVLAYKADRDNGLRFEWMLMEYMPGRTLRQASRRLAWERKENLVRQLALYQSQLFEHRFSSIGNLYKLEDGSFEVREIVSMAFFWGERGVRQITRGPFKNSHDWLSARLALVHEDQSRILQISDDEDDREDAERAINLAHELDALLPQIFPPENVIEETVIFHDDVTHSNLLVNDDNDAALSALLDWECVSALPLWKACSLPALLDGRTRDAEPIRHEYQSHNSEHDRGAAEENEGLCDMYREHVDDYERGRLQRVFLDEMQRLSPEWLRHHREGALQRDVELAVHYCDSELAMGRIERWLAAYREGKRYSLREAFLV